MAHAKISFIGRDLFKAGIPTGRLSVVVAISLSVEKAERALMNNLGATKAVLENAGYEVEQVEGIEVFENHESNEG